MNQSSTELLQGGSQTLAAVSPEWMDDHPFVRLFRESLKKNNRTATRDHLEDLDEEGYKIAIALCKESKGYCPIRAMFEFRAIQSQPSLEIDITIDDDPLKLTMNRNGKKDLKHNDNLFFEWGYIVILFENYCQFIQLANKKK